MSPALKNGLMLVGLVAILGLAAWFFTKGRKETTYPNDPNTTTAWMCEKCGKHIELTASKYKDWADSKDKSEFKNGRQSFLCPDCKEFTVKRAWIDQETGEWSVPGAAAKAKAGVPKKPK
jgi:LPXTG-motif cell wall-anchored protein